MERAESRQQNRQRRPKGIRATETRGVVVHRAGDRTTGEWRVASGEREEYEAAGARRLVATRLESFRSRATPLSPLASRQSGGRRPKMPGPDEGKYGNEPAPPIEGPVLQRRRRRQEVRVDGFRIDAVDRGRLIEIQQASLGSLRGTRSARCFASHDVTVVKPLAARKLLVRRKRAGGTVLSSRYSPRRETIADLFHRPGPFRRRFSASAA